MFIPFQNDLRWCFFPVLFTKSPLQFFHSADDRLSLKATSGFTAHVKVRHDGNQTWRSHIIYKSMCNINVKYFPFDEQSCAMVFASWSHDVSTLDLRKRHGLPGGKAVAKKGRGSDVFQENEEWTVESITMERNEVRWSESRREEFGLIYP